MGPPVLSSPGRRSRPARVTPTGPGSGYRARMMGMGHLGPDGRRRQRIVAGLIVFALVLGAASVLISFL